MQGTWPGRLETGPPFKKLTVRNGLNWDVSPVGCALGSDGESDGAGKALGVKTRQAACVSCEAHVMEMGKKSSCDELRPCALFPDWRTSTDVIQWRASEGSPKDGQRPHGHRTLTGHLRLREEHEVNTPQPGARGKASSSAQQGVFPRHSRSEKRQAAGSCFGET